jgi:uroporphyrinogen-III decarboxylase
MPDVNSGELKRVLDYTSYFIKNTGGTLPLKITDVQGPLDTAALIMGHTNFLMALQTHPDAVHHVLSLVTDLMIDFIKAQRKIVKDAGCEFVPAMFQPWMPDGMGITISNDECVMISPEMHDEFHVPYINRLSDEFGGIYIHSCGNWEHQFESLAKVKNLRGLEFGASEVPYQKVLDRFSGEIVLCSRIGFHQDTKFNGMTDYVKRMLAAAKTHKGLCINVDITNGIIAENWEPTNLHEIYDLFTIEKFPS